MFGEPIKAAHKFQVSKEVTDLNKDEKPTNSNEHKFAWVIKFVQIKIHVSYETGSCNGKRVGQNCKSSWKLWDQHSRNS
jgi:hypothetical protein